MADINLPVKTETVGVQDNIYMDAYLEILGTTVRTPNTPYIPTIPMVAFPGSEPQEEI